MKKTGFYLFLVAIALITGCSKDNDEEITPAPETFDFVTFSNAKIPAPWQVVGWDINNSYGYDDDYSIQSNIAGNTIVMTKTGNDNITMLEFYLYGGLVLYIDGKKAGDWGVSSSNWEKIHVYLSPGMHTLKWESTGYARIDAIRFKKGLAPGMPYQGGVITYVDNTGIHGFIAAPSDQGSGTIWAHTDDHNNYIPTGAIGKTIGTGQANTTKIVQAVGAGVYAAKLCDDLIIYDYQDWYLPSFDELNEMFKYRYLINMDINSAYWSSTAPLFETESYSNAYIQYFSNGYQIFHSRDMNSHKVRAIRSF